jgi:response regulator RpfG family c-di-GMP phosphodiesterase
MKNSNSQSVELYINTYNIEKAITECHKQTGDGLSPEAQDAFMNVMAEVYEIRRTLKPMLSEDNKKRVEQLTSSR